MKRIIFHLHHALPTSHFALPLLPPGEYQLTVQRDGFRTIKRSGVKLEVAQSAEINFTLDVGQVDETVSINADAE